MILLVAVSACEAPALPTPTSPATPAAAGAPAPPLRPVPSVEASALTGADAGAPADASATLVRLSQDWARDPELSNRHPADDLARCPQAQPGASTAALAPAPFVRLEGIATHTCDAVLWVFLGCARATDDGTACQTWRERLVLAQAATGASRVLGDIEPVVGGNSAGLFVPFAFTRDDRRVLLRAWMFSPGAGGGAVDYGVGVVATSTERGPSPLDVQPLPVRDPSFYADFGCAIGLAASELTPSYPQPGFPSNNGGALVAVDLGTLAPRPLLKERDTTYAVERVDEKARTLQVEVKRHAFGKDCPRAEEALGCSKATTSKRTIALPPCERARQ